MFFYISCFQGVVEDENTISKTQCTPHLHAGEVERLDAHLILTRLERKLRKSHSILSFPKISAVEIVRGLISLMFGEDLIRHPHVAMR